MLGAAMASSIAACSGAVPEAALAPSPATTVETPATADPDVVFIRDMIVHHGQALELARLARDRSAREDVRLLALRIELSQRDEIELMRRLLRARGVEEDGHSALRHDQISGGRHEDYGMIAADEFVALEAARGETFDSLFLALMVRHHEGAVRMVADLFATETGGQDSAIFRLASSIESDQRAEIDRMRAIIDRMSR
jgi:uncharacterized protein (DUF305 family)